MRLIIKEYLSSLKERGELDAVLPDLLSQMGLHVFSIPGRGTRQYGVDIGAVGAIDDNPEKVILLSVKPGNLSRKDWDSSSEQALRPSLNEIIDVYIPTHLPSEHKGLPIEICICIGGDIEESVRLSITQYEEAHKTETIKIVEWDGDRLAAMIEKYFLHENLLLEGTRPLLRKSIALLDEPQASFKHFTQLVQNLVQLDSSKAAQVLTVLRQMNICLSVLLGWAREGGNLESSYLAGEYTLLHAWDLTKGFHTSKTKVSKDILDAFFSAVNTYQLITREYLAKILPHVGKRHGLSSSVRSANKIDINLKLFDMLGRLAMAGIWNHWSMQLYQADEESQDRIAQESKVLAEYLKRLIVTNPTLLSPVKDEQAIDIFLAILFLSFDAENEKDILDWFSRLFDRSIFAYQVNGMYPCVHSDYVTLLNHPERDDDEYRQEATSGSILYPTIGLWAAILKDEELYKKIQKAKKEDFSHCNFQFWYPTESTESHLYKNDDIHGATFTDVPIEQEPDKFLKSVWDECRHLDVFEKLSCVAAGLWPVLLVACRHYRLPVPIDFTLGYSDDWKNVANGEV